MSENRSHTASGCTCHVDRDSHYREPYWHDDECPVRKRSCEECDGQGRKLIPLSCECCSDWEQCEYCDGTGEAKTDEQRGTP
jgi:hypothetical protein